MNLLLDLCLYDVTNVTIQLCIAVWLNAPAIYRFSSPMICDITIDFAKNSLVSIIDRYVGYL